MIHGKPMTITEDALNEVIGILEYAFPDDRDKDLELIPNYVGTASHGAPGIGIEMPDYVRTYFFRKAYDLLGETTARTLANKGRTDRLEGRDIVLYFPGVTLAPEPADA